MACNRSPRLRAAGVTITELLVAVVILATCAAIALPNYRHQLIRVRRSEATTALLRVQTAEEKHYQRTGRYTSAIPAASPADSDARYDLTVTAGDDGLSYLATATPRGDSGQADDTQCLAFTIDERGTRGITGPADPRACWNDRPMR